MLKIRLRRMGAKKAPFYRIVVADSRAPRDGAFVEEIGYYNPLTDPEQVVVDGDKAKQWIKNGAQPTETVRGLFKKATALSTDERKKSLPKPQVPDIAALVEFIAKSLVDEPSEVKVAVKADEAGEETTIELSVAKDDMGKVIGKQGRIAKAIRTVVRAASVKSEKKYRVDIL